MTNQTYKANYKRAYRLRNLARVREDSRRWNNENKERHQATNHLWYVKNKELTNVRRRANRVKRYSGLTLFDYDSMVREQKGKCAICKNLVGNKLHVDHDHATGKVRQLLCSRCNTGLGLFKENIDSLKEAIKYLKKHK